MFLRTIVARNIAHIKGFQYTIPYTIPFNYIGQWGFPQQLKRGKIE